MHPMSVELIGMDLMGVHLTGMYLIGTYKRASYGRASLYRRVSPTGELWIISLLTICVQSYPAREFA
jgi:hypothetical protein